ncbi:MAG TPA: phosphomannomutase/phosphoglucomutase [Candidatus Coprenecus stercoravium]|uniref:Phosphomannomutase/phosphoglucomutase n=1 Tax=Candidatus Coprenecus stercoravium TaxID=2840735 RepID=A0A9D2K8E2_9BACT|nr:phosphomannomutase/phosphoglucomutase [Candidatus Coprenecus stercoravium]
MGAFHAYDIRGRWGVDFDRDTVYKTGYFLPSLLGCRKVAVGRDMRLSSPELHEALLKGLTDAGADVYDLGLATTPYVYYATASKGFHASVQITASHNPREDNGLKVSRENALPVGYDTGLGTIEKWILEGRPCIPVSEADRGRVIPLDLRDEYLAFQRRYAGDLSGLRICADLSNGASCLFVKQLLPSSVEYLCDTLDGSFPNHEPNPLLPENTAMLRSHVLSNGCDVGVIYDGDADRVVFVDEKGSFISPDLIIALLGQFFMRGVGTSPAARERAALRTSGQISGVRALQDIRSSKAVGEYLSPMGVEMHTWRVGRAYAAPKLRDIDGLFGGELAGHYYFKDFFYSDSGIMASLIVLDIVAEMKRRGRSLSQLISEISRYSNSGEINFRVADKQTAMDAVRQHFISSETPSAEMDFDGYRVEFPQWWFNIRPSNTEPYLRFICEASSPELLADKVAQAREIIERFE